MLSQPPLSWDLLLPNKNGEPILAVEVKTKAQASPDWATKLRRNMLAHSLLKDVPFLLIVVPDKFYLWTDQDSHIIEAQPSYIIDSQPILQPYLERAKITVESISEQSLEAIVAAWLTEMIQSDVFRENIASTYPWLIDSGLYSALTQDVLLVSEAAA